MTCRWIRVLLPLLLALPVAGCAGTTGADSGSSAGSQADLPVTITRTGGLAGVTDRVTVDPTGHWVRTDRSGRTVSGNLTTAQRDRLRQLAGDPRLRTEAGTTASPGPCRDAFTYTVAVGNLAVSYVDCPGQPAPAVGSSIVAELADALAD